MYLTIGAVLQLLQNAHLLSSASALRHVSIVTEMTKPSTKPCINKNHSTQQANLRYIAYLQHFCVHTKTFLRTMLCLSTPNQQLTNSSQIGRIIFITWHKQEVSYTSTTTATGQHTSYGLSTTIATRQHISHGCSKRYHKNPPPLQQGKREKCKGVSKIKTLEIRESKNCNASLHPNRISQTPVTLPYIVSTVVAALCTTSRQPSR